MKANFPKDMLDGVRHSHRCCVEPKQPQVSCRSITVGASLNPLRVKMKVLPAVQIENEAAKNRARGTAKDEDVAIP